MALVGNLTATEVLKSALLSNFSELGSNSFQITGDVFTKRKNKRGGAYVYVSEGKNIKWQEAKTFKERFAVPSQIGLSMSGSGTTTVSYNDQKTNPNISAMGVDDAYFRISNTRLAVGRTFSPYELESGSYVCVLGQSIAVKLFKTKWKNSLGVVVTAGAAKFRVIGIAEEKGGSMMMNADNSFYIPVVTARNVYGNRNIVMSVMVTNILQKNIASEEAEGLFRSIRKLSPGTTNNFSIRQNDSLVADLLEDIRVITYAAFIIGMITLLCSVIGLMNIMLVSVAERTREIGVSKALGAKPGTIRGQFLTESVLISVFGGVLGVLLGILAGNIFSIFLETNFIIPWGWMLMGVTICAVVGVISGIYPAIKASRLDPIVALRYE